MLGEHIRALKGGRWNHAIDCGDETVIHLADEGARRAVRRSYRPEFISGAETVEIVTHRQRTYPADEVVARAYSRIADPMLAAMFPTSESFAHWCATGRPSAPGEGAPASPPPTESVKPRGRSARAARKAPAARPSKAAGASRPDAARRPKAKGRSRPAAGGRAKAKRRTARSRSAPRAGTKRRTPRVRRPATKPRRR